MAKLTDEEFEAAVQDALDSIPDEFLDELDNVAFMLADKGWAFPMPIRSRRFAGRLFTKLRTTSAWMKSKWTKWAMRDVTTRVL